MTVCGNKLSGVCGACTLVNICRNNEIANLPKSNIEWMREASLEELAEWMALRLNPGILLALRMKYHCSDINAVREWLKEKHD